MKNDSSPQADRPAARGEQVLAQSVGIALAIAAMFRLADWSHTPLMIVPFATSIVLMMGLPEAEPAQPRALIGGHPVSALRLVNPA